MRTQLRCLSSVTTIFRDRCSRILRRVGLAAAISLAACSDDPIVAPSRPLGQIDSAAAFVLQGGSVSLPVPANSDAPLEGGTPWIATGLVVRRGYNLRMQMPSTMTATLLNIPPPPDSPEACVPWMVPPGEVPPSGQTWPFGIPSLGRVINRITQDSGGSTGSQEAGVGWNRRSDGSRIGVRYIGRDFPDSGYLSTRREPLDGVCGGHVKYGLSGSQNITVDFPELEVTRNPWFVTAGSPVHFTAVAHGFTPTLSQWTWHWRTDSTNTELLSCAGQSSCDHSPPTGGRMNVFTHDADLLGYEGESDSVEVVPCPTPDSVLNHPKVRKALKASLDSSNIDSVTSARRERILGFYRDTTDASPSDTSVRPLTDSLAIVVHWATPFAGTTPCRGVAALPSNASGWVLVRYGHSHPFSGGTDTSSAEIQPTNCGPTPAGAAYLRGPSTDDWNTGISRGVPGFIIDKEEVARFDAANPEASNRRRRPSLVSNYPWNSTTCRW